MIRPLHLAALLPILLVSAVLAEEPRTITTTGSAVIYVTPDKLDLRFSVHTFDADLIKSKSLNDEAAKEMLAFLKSQGIEAKDVQTDAVNSRAVYEEREENGRRIRGPITGYTVTRTYGVTLRDVSKLTQIYDKLLPDTRVTLYGHTFGTSELRKHRDKVRVDAALAAREKAALLASTLDVKLGVPRSISESDVHPSNGYFRAAQAVTYDPSAGGDETSPIGQIEVRAEVTVVFELVG